MKIIDVEQGTPEWHKFRLDGLGASDIPIITGSFPYKTPYELWEIKCGFRTEDPLNAAMMHGIQNEPKAREWLNRHLNLNLKPLCVQDDENPVFRASLDGYDSFHNVVVEIKCPITANTIDRARTLGAVHDYWMDQMQWQIMITEPKRAILAVWDYVNEGCILLDMYGCESKILEMRKKADEFWKGVQMGKSPLRETSDYIEIEDEELHKKLIEYQKLCEKEKACKSLKTALKKEIEEFGDDGSFSAYGFKIQRCESPVSYDYEQMQLDGIDLEKYKKAKNDMGFYKIMCPKNKEGE